MKRKEPKQCPACKSKHFSYEDSEITIERDVNGMDTFQIESEWTCGECGEIFYHHARYVMGECLSESVST